MKNLGDGHLLVWEAPGGLTPELLEPVMEAARKAQTAFAAFVAGQGALGAQLPRQVGIGIAFGETFKSDDYYGVAELLSEQCRLVQSYPLYVGARDLSVLVYVRD